MIIRASSIKKVNFTKQLKNFFSLLLFLMQKMGQRRVALMAKDRLSWWCIG